MEKEVFDVLKCLVTLLSLVIGYFVIPYLKAKIYNTKYEQLLIEVDNVVRSLQQVMDVDKANNVFKREHAVEYITRYINDHNIKITSEQIEILIEAAVYSMKEKSK